MCGELAKMSAPWEPSMSSVPQSSTCYGDVVNELYHYSGCYRKSCYDSRFCLHGSKKIETFHAFGATST